METKKQLKENRTSLINEVVVRKHIEDHEYFITMGRYVDGKLITYTSKNQVSIDLFGRRRHITAKLMAKYGLFYPIL